MSLHEPSEDVEVEKFIEEFQRRRSSVLSAGSKNSIRCTNRLTTARILSLRITNSWSPANLFKLKALDNKFDTHFLFHRGSVGASREARAAGSNGRSLARG